MWAKTMLSILGVLFLVLVSALGLPLKIPDAGISVTINQGTVVGNQAEDGEYFEFYGIPYADSTSGSNRFKAPSPPPLFEDVFVADRKDIKCVRALGTGFEGTEDCLVANILIPKPSSTGKLPVMVWIKGKEFDQVYEQELSFKNLIEKEVVVVSLNFRESILGFLCLGTETAPGNAGLKDIIAGLQWVQENIEQFGGDPTSVTLIGHGSGAAAVDLVSLSPMANGLVHKIISQSGTALAPWAVTRDNFKYAILVAEALGHTVTDIETLSQAFTRTSVAALMGVINELDLIDNSLAFAPCLENESLESVEPFMIKSPYQTLTEGDFLQVPFLTGFVKNEGTIRATEALEDDWLERMNSEFMEFLQSDLIFETDEQEEEIAQEIKQYYFSNETIDISNIENYISYHGDTMILVSAIREAHLRAVVSSQSIYLYQFSYDGSLGESFIRPLEINGASHSEDLAYLFHDTTNNDVLSIDLRVSNIIIERWTNFAKSGEPTSETSNIIWQAYTADEPHYLHILNNDEDMEDDESEEDSQSERDHSSLDSNENILVEDGEPTLEIDLLDPHSKVLTFWTEIYEEHFRDAESRWKLNGREDEDYEVAVEDGSGDGENGDNGDSENGGEDENDEDEDEDDDNSATTAVGYTFLIVSLFTILNQIHLSQIIS